MGLFRPKYAPRGMTYKAARAAGALHESAIWFARYQLHGRKVVESTGTTKHEEARTWLRKRLGAIARQEPVLVRADRVTFADMAARLREDYSTNGKHLPTLEARLRHLDAAFGPVKLARLIPADLARYKADRLAAGASNGTVNRELEVLARAFTLGRRLGLLNAALDVRAHRLGEAPPRSGFFEREQYEAVRRELAAGSRQRYGRPDLVLAVTLYHEYGWRLQEVLGLEVRHVNLDEGDHGSIRLDAGVSKTGDARVIFLTPEVRRLVDEQLARVATLRRQLDRVVPYLFPHLKGRRRGERVGDFARAWRLACLRAGLAITIEREDRPALIRVHRTRHDFRRTAARNMVNAGIPEAVCMTVTGHATRSMFDRYNIVSPAQKQEAARRIATASEAAAQRVAAAAPTVVSLVPRLVPTQGTARGQQARRGTVGAEAISSETLETASV
jgi:integrase